MPKRVAVIGAGVSGLSTARVLLEEGFECVVFERGERLGGVWANGYVNFGAQVQHELYEFPDWPLPEGTPDFTPGPIIQQYLEDYARHFGVWPAIRFGATVTALRERQDAAPGWLVTSATDGETREEAFDLVVVATGLYSQRPHLPSFEGLASFTGEAFHISEFDSLERVRDKRVVVVGYGKSATDAAVECAAVGAETTIVFREPHWPVPRKLLGVLPFKWALLSRLTSTLIPPYYRPSAAERVVHSIGKPLVWLWWRIVEGLLIAQCGLWSRFGTRVSLVPRQPVEVDTFGEAVMLPRPEFYRFVRQGRIIAARGEVKAFTPAGARLLSGRQIEADVVVLATGWEADDESLPPDVRRRLGSDPDGRYLYRQILHPDVPHLYFIGAASTIESILTYALQARWLVDLLLERHALPDADAMRREIEELKAWKRSWMPESRARGARLLLHQIHYHDQLLRDMGLDPRRKRGPLAPFKEVFAPYEPRDYRTVVSGREEREKRRRPVEMPIR